MHKHKVLAFIFLLSPLFNTTLSAQQKEYTAAQAHSHNDYLQARPFHAALSAGFGSIEADIFPLNGDLFVAHSAKEIQTTHTLSRLYLAPLKQNIKTLQRELQLLIDIKKDPDQSLELLIKQLKPFKKQLSTPQKKGKIKIVITGSLPQPADYAKYPNYIYFDNDLKTSLTEAQWERVGMISSNFKLWSKWRGKGAVSTEDLAHIQSVVNKAHDKRKPFRFWGMPDTPDSWALQKRLNIEWIGTDHIEDLTAFLRL